MVREDSQKMTEETLFEAQAEKVAIKQGHLKIFLGYASGVGKSFRMLDEARRRAMRGQDVVIGAVQPHVAPEVAALLEKLEVIPLKKVRGGDVVDLDALIRRDPAVCFIDGLAYDNPPGSRNKTRWEDVRQLVHTGMKVVASINIQYIAELRDEVEAVTGKHVAQTVPVSFIRSADEIEIVDAPPTEAHERSAAEPAGQLARLREIALVLAADVVDQQLTSYLESHGIRHNFGTQERILVCLAADSKTQEMIETAKMIAQRFYGELVVVNVDQPEISSVERAAVDENLSLARAAGVRVEILHGRDPVTAILEFARSRGITQVFVGHSRSSRSWSRLFGNSLNRLVRSLRGMDVRIFPNTR